jgi:hypothetical protein
MGKKYTAETDLPLTNCLEGTRNEKKHKYIHVLHLINSKLVKNERRI